MTEPMSPFGGTAVAAPPLEMTPPSDVAGGSENRRKLMLVGLVVGVLVLAAAAYFLFIKGGSSDNLAPVVTHGHSSSAGHPGSSTGHKPKTVTLPGEAKKPAGRNPFLALVVPPTSAPTTGPQSGAGGSSSQTGAQNTSSNSGTATQPTGTRHHGTQSTPVIPVWVDLQSLHGTRSATFVVGYSDGSTKNYRVTAPAGNGETIFAADFALLSITDRHATVKFGDGTPFDLTRGFRNRHSV